MESMTANDRVLNEALGWVMEHDGELLRRLAEYDVEANACQ